MFKKKLKRYIPTRNQIKSYRSLQIFGKYIYNPNLWHFNRISVSRAIAVGLFFAWIPVPFQMLLAAGVAILIHSNLAISIALVWITNPLTMPPLYFFSYQVGRFILSVPPRPFHFELSWDWLFSTLSEIWRPFFLGCLIVAILSSMLGYFLTRILWRYLTIKNWKKRKKTRNNSLDLK
jgi:uncharacterized protein